MDPIVQALVMGLTQGLTEFLPVSSSGHLIVVPFLLGFTDPFIDSLAFSVMLHLGTLVALLVYFRADWLRLIPAGLAAIRDRSLHDPVSGRANHERRLAWLLVVATIPAVIAGVLLNDVIETNVRSPGLVAVMFVVGAAILWLADRFGRHAEGVDEVTFPLALGIGVAQAVALIPGISRSGISISAGLFAGLTREAAARFSFLMATPVIAGAGAWEGLKLLRGQGGPAVELGPLLVGMLAALVAGVLAIEVTLRYLRTHPVTIFAVYRVIIAIVVLVAWLNLWNRPAG
ncbi:MAG TPA: undecaprenyl-diphosphate phosphatase [Candidatus Binatus sp.]|nr:undecaprenyl-diphosphate phosphatase [Candidatus Binatus sp.]